MRAENRMDMRLIRFQITDGNYTFDVANEFIYFGFTVINKNDAICPCYKLALIISSKFQESFGVKAIILYQFLYFYFYKCFLSHIATNIFIYFLAVHILTACGIS